MSRFDTSDKSVWSTIAEVIRVGYDIVKLHCSHDRGSVTNKPSPVFMTSAWRRRRRRRLSKGATNVPSKERRIVRTNSKAALERSDKQRFRHW